MDKQKKKGITWGEAAKIVLENASRPLTHKEILQGILERNLKEVKLTGSSALACINAMLHANSRTPSDLFHKVEGRSGCYRLNENHAEHKDFSTSDSESPGSSSNSAISDTKELSQFGENSSDNLAGPSNTRAETIPWKSLTFPSTNVPPASGSLPPISSMLGSYSSRVTTTTSVTSSVACAIADSRLNSLIAPTPDNLPQSSTLSKKRVVKPRFQSDGPTTKKPRVTFKLDKEKKGGEERPSRPAVKTKAELKYMENESSPSKNFIPPVLKPPMYPTHTVVKTSSGGFFGQKRHKKMSIAAQVKRSKEGQVDLVSPDSILSKINVRSLINFKTFHLLPPHYQYQLVKLLPEVDREVGSKGDLRPSSSAFTNEFFTSAFRSWKERLSEGEFTPEMSQKIQQEQDKFFSQDPWKTKHFEPVWGQRFLGNERYVSPVEKSHQIMEELKLERLKEQERQNLKETEDMNLNAPNKMDRKQPECVELPAKNLTAKQRAALLRQQKLTNAKSATNKATSCHKKATDVKPSSRGNGGKSSSKDIQVKEENSNKKVTKVGEKTKGKQTSKTSKQGKVNRSAKAISSDNSELQKMSTDTTNTGILVSMGQPPPEQIAPCKTNKEGIFQSERSTLQADATPEDSRPDSSPLTSQESTASGKPGRGSTPKNGKKKISKPTQKMVVVNNALRFECSCMLKPMMMCRQCGAFCHSDCISPVSVCSACKA